MNASEPELKMMQYGLETIVGVPEKTIRSKLLPVGSLCTLCYHRNTRHCSSNEKAEWYCGSSGSDASVVWMEIADFAQKRMEGYREPR